MDIEVEQIIALVFAPDEDPIFIDGTAPIVEIAREPASFIEDASKFFGILLGPQTLDMTIPELAAHIRKKRASRS